jgi:flavin-binding protein dodecin
MSIARVTEISVTSKKSFDHAIKKGVKRACETLKNVTNAWVKDQEVGIRDGEIYEYRVKMKITFVLNDKSSK